MGQKISPNLSGQIKITQPLGGKKITQFIGTKKNHPTYWDKKYHQTSQDEKKTLNLSGQTKSKLLQMVPNDYG